MGQAQLHITRYGAATLAVLRDVVREVKAGDPLAPVTVIVPDHLTGLTVRRTLARGLTDGSPGIAAVDCLTLAGLAERFAAPVFAAQSRRPATAALVAACIRESLSEHPGEFGVVADHPATSAALERVSRELRLVDDATLASLRAEPGTLVREVLRIHDDVWVRLSKHWYDEADLLRAAALVCRTPAGLSPTVVYLPVAMRPVELEVLTALAAASDIHVVCGVTGDARADAGPLRVAAAVTGSAAGEVGSGEASVTVPAAESDPATADRVIHASDADDEVRAVVREVVAALGTHPAHRVAVLYGNRRPYARIVQEQLTAAGVTFNGPGARPVTERAFARFVLGLLRIQRSGYPRADVLQTLSEVPARAVDGSAIPAASWERLSRNCGIVDGADWRDRVDATIATLAAREDPHGYLARRIAEATTMRDTVWWIRDRLTGIGGSATWQEAADSLRTLVSDLLPDTQAARLPPEEQYARVSVLGAIEGLTVLDESAIPVSLVIIEEVLIAQLESATMRVGRFGEGVYVGPVESGAGLDLDVVVVCGLSEDVYPGRLSDDPLLAEAVRETFGEALVTLRERIAEKHRCLLAAFALAGEVAVTFARGDLRQQTQRIPSRWLLPSIRSLTGEMTLTATGFADVSGLTEVASYTSGLSTATHLATEQEWRLRAGLVGWRFADEALTAARAMNAGRGDREGGRFDGMIGVDAARLSPLSEGEYTSPTMLEKYVACPFQHLVNRVLRVSPIEDPESIVQVSKADIGTFVHHCFDVLITERQQSGQLPGYGEPWDQQAHVRLLQIADEFAAEFVTTGRAGHTRLWEQSLVEIKGVLQTMLDVDDSDRASRGLAVVSSEAGFGRGGVDVVLDVPGGTVQLTGAADKVDRAADGTLVVTDIKTGKPGRFMQICPEDPVIGGTKLQLPAYAHAVRALYGDAHTPVEAAYWFVGDGDGRRRVPLELTAEVDTTFREAVGTVSSSIRDGVFPLRPPATDDFSWIQCPYCNPDGLGYAEPRSRWQQLRGTRPLRDLVTLIEPDALATTGDPAEEEK
ncbi:PD-(D/E)XK nuclease family protein [Rudaeicoccus suwonensis]|uniref:ATP-dependent helicase/DNAse subunit B n=1 Tax=Rudaeicoccus suwonensis TaxID=657409 RepID=A0A561EC85_9MICO|nr:PD-(D/E)XK nuclease family protein [Rudaeicoccus suwonensis]TWE13221.1 ATP-dependent helicase/DNAse subunit B [Rudaeicoccus suwonensis]